MSIVRRMKDMSRATWNEKLEKVDDPVRFLDKYLLEKQQSLHDLEKLFQTSSLHTQTLRKQYLDASLMADKREEQAVLALRAEEEEVARMALQEKIAYSEKKIQYKKLYEQGKETMMELEEQWNHLQAEIQEGMEKRQYFHARLESLRIQKQMETRSSSFRTHSFSWMNRFESALNDLEIETSVFREMQGHKSTRKYEHPSNALDVELEKLRAKIGREGG
jgi:phage shock protein A